MALTVLVKPQSPNGMKFLSTILSNLNYIRVLILTKRHGLYRLNVFQYQWYSPRCNPHHSYNQRCVADFLLYRCFFNRANRFFIGLSARVSNVACFIWYASSAVSLITASVPIILTECSTGSPNRFDPWFLFARPLHPFFDLTESSRPVQLISPDLIS